MSPLCHITKKAGHHFFVDHRLFTKRILVGLNPTGPSALSHQPPTPDDGHGSNLACSLVRIMDTRRLHMLGNLEEKNRQVFSSLQKSRKKLQLVIYSS